MVTAAQVGRYLEEYVREYRSEYRRFTAPAPDGGGYPSLAVSPYITGGLLECYVAADGAVLLDMSDEPPGLWQVAGGPAIMSDLAESRSPPWVAEVLAKEGLTGKPIGIYRVVSPTPIPAHIWSGNLGVPNQTYSGKIDDLALEVYRYNYHWRDLIQRLSYGVLDLILDLHLPEKDAEFWNPRVIRNLGFMPADRSASRFFRYAELLRHTEAAAWDPRSVWARVHVDLRRDFAHAAVAAAQDQDGSGFLSFTHPEPPLGPAVRDRLSLLMGAADGLEALLAAQPDAPEAVFHSYLFENPVLLDVYAQAESKPRLVYPEGESPTGKSYVEPDFILKYWNKTYRLVELERPNHIVATQEGHPRVAVTHAAYQIAEWKDYIDRNYHLLSLKYPGIVGSYTSTVVIGRESRRSIGKADDVHRYMGLLRRQLAVDEVLTYDDLIYKARAAVAQLQALADAASG